MRDVREPPGSLYDEGPGRERAPSHADAPPSLPAAESSAEVLRGAPMSVLWFVDDDDDDHGGGDRGFDEHDALDVRASHA